jgi:sialic acid synthase SpsE/sugar phosphate isomerase/epimerase
MLITKSIEDFIIFKDVAVVEVLKKISNNNRKIVFVIDGSGVLEGVIADGDIRQWLIDQPDAGLTAQASEVMNTSFRACSINDPQNEISNSFDSSIDIIPLIDKNSRLKAIAINKGNGIQIGSRVISNEHPVFIIAEIGNNHNGDIALAKKLVDSAVSAGADCVKFQLRDVTSLYRNDGKPNDASADLGAQYTLDLLNKFQLSNEELIIIFDYCKEKGTIPLCTPWDTKSVALLEDYGMEAYKVASADLTNHELLETLVNTGKPLICSTGMSTESEIALSVDFLRSRGAQFVLLHCNSTYPTPLRDINLEYIKNLQSHTGSIVGYSGHELSIAVPVAAVTLGAKIIEKHFTIDKNMEGNDHKVSLLPAEFADMVHQIRQVEESLGHANERAISQGEMINREILAKSLVINVDLKKGEMIKREMIVVKSPGQGIQPYRINELIGKLAKQDFKSGDFFFESDIQNTACQPRNYSFNRPFGIPVRFHDYEKLVSKSNFDFVEFHFSYQDLELDMSEYISGEQKIDFAVHCPELFKGDHIMDLSSENTDYRTRSIANLEKVIKKTCNLKKFFRKTDQPILVVINAGGFNKTGFLPPSKRPEMYKRVANALSGIDETGVELIIQTMPPFPWHFGGQSYHNIFVDPDEIVEFCEKENRRICFDLSHSQMACNYYSLSLSDFIKKVGKHTAHLHIADALGIDGEGIQVNHGDINFPILAKDLDEYVPSTPFIPEVWQGHKQNGSGFWPALEYLEGLL